MLSVCMIALNEEKLLEDCLSSVLPIADEIVFGLDKRTTDQTVDVAQMYGARIIPFEWQDSFAAARNVALDAARGDWILVVDADERLLPEGADAFEKVLEQKVADDIDGFSPLWIETDLAGNTLSIDRISGRLFRNDPNLRYVGRVHEEVRYLPDPPRTNFVDIGEVPFIRHVGYDPTIKEQRHKIERDTRLIHLRIEDNQHDAVGWCYLALMSADAGQPDKAAYYAMRALDCGPRTLHPDRIPQLRALMAAELPVA